MRHALVVATVVGALALVGCGPKGKVQLEYEEPVTHVWSGDASRQPAPPQAAAETPPVAPAQPYGAAAQGQYGQPQAYPPPAPYPGPAPYPQSAPYPQQAPYPQAAPYPPPTPYPSAPYPQQTQPTPAPARAQMPPGGAWQTPGAPATVVNDPSTATTVVIPDQNPTTQPTIKRRTGWVRGGYD